MPSEEHLEAWLAILHSGSNQAEMCAIHTLNELHLWLLRITSVGCTVFLIISRLQGLNSHSGVAKIRLISEDRDRAF